MIFKRLFLLICACLTGVCLLAQSEGKPKFSNHYYKRVAQFNSETPVIGSDIVFLGNSLTEGGAWSEYFADTQIKLAKKGGAIRNRGIVGDDAVGMYARLEQILPGNPKKIFILVGVNDISHHISADSVLFLVDKVIGKIRSDAPKTKLYMQSLLPVNEAKCKYKTMIGKTDSIVVVNKGLVEMAKKYKVDFINLYDLFTEPGSNQMRGDLTSDGLHINEAGYAIWANRIKKYVK